MFHHLAIEGELRFTPPCSCPLVRVEQKLAVTPLLSCVSTVLIPVKCIHFVVIRRNLSFKNFSAGLALLSVTHLLCSVHVRRTENSVTGDAGSCHLPDGPDVTGDAWCQQSEGESGAESPHGPPSPGLQQLPP